MTGRFRYLATVLVACAVATGCNGPTQPTSLSVTGISPNSGSMLGGTQVTISGSGFLEGATVLFAGIPGVTRTVSTNTIVVETPAYKAGGVVVEVANRNGKSAQLLPGYTFEVDPAFAISGVVTELTTEGIAPVEGVLVSIAATGASVLTDASGAYRLGGLRRTGLVVAMTKPGYTTVTVTITLTSDAQFDRQIARFKTFALSGMVYETTPSGRLPLEGVVLYCDGCGSPVGHTFVTTDANGLYKFDWTLPGKNWIQFVSKEGYRYAGPLELFGIPVMVDGDTRFDIELVKK